MGPKGRLTTTLSVALAMCVLPLAAEAQLAKRGSYASHFAWQMAPKSMPLGTDRTLVVYEVTGTHLNDAGPGFLHGVGGTGKYTGLTGKSTWYPVGAPGGAYGYSVWKGEWQLPD
jgi:hypothetical protein